MVVMVIVAKCIRKVIRKTGGVEGRREWVYV
jgi:hypothetical protein